MTPEPVEPIGPLPDDPLIAYFEEIQRAIFAAFALDGIALKQSATQVRTVTLIGLR